MQSRSPVPLARLVPSLLPKIGQPQLYAVPKVLRYNAQLLAVGDDPFSLPNGYLFLFTRRVANDCRSTPDPFANELLVGKHGADGRCRPIVKSGASISRHLLAGQVSSNP